MSSSNPAPTSSFDNATFIRITSCLFFVGILYEISLLIVLFTKILKKKSIFQSPYFVIIVVVALVDLGQMIVAVYMYIYPSNGCEGVKILEIYDHYIYFFTSTTAAVLTLNRFTVIFAPVKNQRYWNRWTTSIIIFLMVFLPMPSAILSEVGSSVRRPTMVVTCIISYSMTTISLLITFFVYGHFIFGTNQFKGLSKLQVEAEKRLLAVILFSNSTGFLYLTVKYINLAYNYKILPSSSQDLALFCHAVGNLLYIFNHYGELLFLLFMSRELQKSYFIFYFPCLKTKFIANQTRIIKCSVMDPGKTTTILNQRS